MERKVRRIKGILFQDKRKQHSGHLESLVVVVPYEMSSLLVNKIRSEVTPKVRKLESWSRQKTGGLVWSEIMTVV